MVLQIYLAESLENLLRSSGEPSERTFSIDSKSSKDYAYYIKYRFEIRLSSHVWSKICRPHRIDTCKDIKNWPNNYLKKFLPNFFLSPFGHVSTADLLFDHSSALRFQSLIKYSEQYPQSGHCNVTSYKILIKLLIQYQNSFVYVWNFPGEQPKTTYPIETELFQRLGTSCS